MSNILYSNLDALNIGSQRVGIKIKKTNKGISVERVSLYNNEPTTVAYYKEYPELPSNWDAIINDNYTSAKDLFMHELENYTPYRTVKK